MYSWGGKVLKDLTDREIAGFAPKWIPIYTHDADMKSERVVTELGLTFVASIDNRNFAGFLTHDQIAKRIYKSVGCSGSNLEYTTNLHHSLVDAGHPDPHISSVMSLVEKNQAKW